MFVIYNDGGRSKYFTAKNVRDCAVRAIAIATGKDYMEVYKALKEMNKGESCRNGTPKKVSRKLLEQWGWKWVACTGIGKGCTMHMIEDELPKGTIIVQLSKHLACVKEGVLHDTFDSSVNSYGSPRQVYGYYIKGANG